MDNSKITPKETLISNSEKIDQILSWARSNIGNKEYTNWCQKFVGDAYSAAGLKNRYPKNSAKDAYFAFCQSNRKDNIPLAACVYFDVKPFGHVGIFSGNGMMIDAGTRGVRERPISDVKPYLGWGFNGNMKP